MNGPGDWLIPELSLQSELEMECDRRAAAHLSRDQLAGKIDELIQAWYMQHSLINRMLGEIRQLQVKVALAGPPVPSKREPEQRHLEWAGSCRTCWGSDEPRGRAGASERDDL